MLRCALSVALAIGAASPAWAESDLESGLAGALRGCETWVLDPESWAEGPAPFLAKLGLGAKAGFVSSVDAASLPPEPLRQANHYLWINSTSDTGYILVVSDQLPICHITGGGGLDLQPAAEAVLASPTFLARWEKTDDKASAGMISSTYRSRIVPTFSIVLSRADKPGERLDRVQLIATAQMAL